MRRYLPSTVAVSTLYFIAKLTNSKNNESNTHINSILELTETPIAKYDIKLCAK